MKKHYSCARSMVLTMLLLGSTVSAGILADSENDFSGTQGSGNWYYGYLETSFGSDSFQPMNYYQWVDPYWRWKVQPDTYTSIYALSMHPNGPLSSEGANTEQWPVRRWINTSSEALIITGRFYHVGNVSGNADGATASIRVDGAQVWEEWLECGDTSGLSYALDVISAPGKAIDFILKPGTNDYNDAFAFTGTITAVPEPSAAALAGLGLFLLALRRRR